MVVAGDSCTIVRIVPERLHDMNVPRSGHNVFYAGGELTVTGGHTTNFVPTPTAEYFSGGEWHLLQMAYPHDNGFAAALQSGEVIIGGGHDESLGIGQTFNLERYLPATHSFEGFGCLDRRRVLASGTQLADGRVIISGNHYASDAIGCYDGNPQVQPVKPVRQGRSNPYILPIASDDALILSGGDLRMNHPDSVWADRLKGDAFRVPLLEQWQPVFSDQPFSSAMCSMGGHAYLLSVVDKSGQLGFAVMRDTTFALLPTSAPVPMRTALGPIFYKGPAVVDSLRQRGYVIGVDSLCRHQYVLAIDYAQLPAVLTLYYTDALDHATVAIPILAPDGDLILAGGEPEDNYKPLAAVWRYRFGTAPLAAAPVWPIWIWVAVVLAAIAAVAVIAYLLYVRRKKRLPVGDDFKPCTGGSEGGDVSKCKANDLIDHICRLMDEEQFYLRSDLKLQDVAVRLGTNSSYVSECINSCRGQSFSQFVNTYRVRHAQELLRRQPDVKTAAVAMQSGFSTEASFFRNFKAITGMTPREWLQSGETTIISTN